MSFECPGLTDFLSVAQAVTGLRTLIRVADLGLCQPASADEEFYPGFVDKAAVLLVRLAKNHPLPGGNKRAAWVTL